MSGIAGRIRGEEPLLAVAKMNSPSIIPVSGRPQDHRALRAILISQAYNVIEARNSDLAPAKARLLFKKRAVGAPAGTGGDETMARLESLRERKMDR
jgi:hypothetical protein